MIRVRVPATTANMGPGFDCLGMALNLYTDVEFEEIEYGLIIDGCEPRFQNEDNLIYQTLLTTFKKVGYKHKGMKITIDSEIPVSRGLGSSAACIIAAILAANEISNARLSKLDILNIATGLEGHPDNVAPAIFGGMVASIYDGERVYFNEIPLHDSLAFYTLIPDFTLSTSDARAVLPKEIPFKDAVFNISRVALMISSLIKGNLDLLNVSIQDKLHQQYRGPLIPEYKTIMENLNKLKVKGSFLSGAGPTIIALADKDDPSLEADIKNMIKDLENNWTLKKLYAEIDGAIVRKE